MATWDKPSLQLAGSWQRGAPAVTGLFTDSAVWLKCVTYHVSHLPDMSWQRRGVTYRAIDSPILSDFPIEADLQSLSLRSAKIYFPNPIERIFIHSSL